MSDRRYSDDEVAEIFRTAAEGVQLSPQQRVRDAGLTLSELQAIGVEVGIAPDAVTRAAVAVGARGGVAQRRLLGLPVGVTRAVHLNRRLTDEEWEHLVVQCREMFSARGATRSDGSLRQWTNGNLQVLLEPTATGQRLRFGTFHGGAVTSIGAGFAAVAVTVATGIAAAVSGTLVHATPGMAFLGLTGVAMIANGALRLPRWARLRARQMEALAAQVVLSETRPAEPPE
jgi:hypothetical protein